MISLKPCKFCGHIPHTKIEIEEYMFFPDTVSLVIVCNCTHKQPESTIITQAGDALDGLIDSINTAVLCWNGRNAE